MKWPLLAGWLLALVLMTPLAGKIEQVQSTSPTAVLPSGLQSTQVATLMQQSSAGEDVGALVVYESPTGLTQTQRVGVADQARRIETALGEGTSVGKPQFSDDGTAALLVIGGIPVDREAEAVDTLRATVAPLGSATVQVSGEAALDVDNDAGDVDAVLLLTSMLIVACLLICSYRSPFLWLLPLIGALVGVQVARGTTYLFGDAGMSVTDISSAIVIVLVFGAATDYALLLLNRYREELAGYRNHHDAVAAAVRRTSPALVASAGTVIVGMLCLLTATLAGVRGLGPIAAAGVAIALLAMLTLLPAMLAVVGRWVFWPRIPTPEHPESAGRHRLWAAVSRAVTGHPRVVVAVVTPLLCGAAVLCLSVRVSADPMDKVPPGSESVQGYATIEQHFPKVHTTPVTVVLPADADSGDRAAVAARITALKDVDQVTRGKKLHGHPQTLEVFLNVPPYSDQAGTVIDRIRDVVGRQSLVGGSPAVQRDFRDAALEDLALLAPLLLLAVSLIIGLLLRAVVAALVILGTAILSLLASFGVALQIFDHVLGYGPVAANLFIYVLLFLVALGVDYNIFLAERIREERRGRSTVAGVRRGMTSTGGVITSAGLVMAGTFLSLVQLPDVTVAEVGLAVGIGVLVDALVVRSLLLPALFSLLGERTWWPPSPAIGRARPVSTGAFGVASGSEESRRTL